MKTYGDLAETLDRYTNAITGKVPGMTPDQLRQILSETSHSFKASVDRIRVYARLSLRPECIEACRTVFETPWSTYWEHTLWNLAERAWRNEIDHADPIIDKLPVERLKRIYGLAKDANWWYRCLDKNENPSGEVFNLRCVELEDWVNINEQHRARTRSSYLPRVSAPNTNQ